MTDTAGFVIEGDDNPNVLTLKIVSKDGNRSIYNVIHGGGGSDIITGLADQYQAFFQKLYGTQLFGEGGSDRITDSYGNDTLSGGSGNDVITDEFGSDVIDGGAGMDTLELEGNRLLSSANLSISGIERLILTGSVTIGDLDLGQFAAVATAGGLASQLKFTQQATIEDINFTKGEWLLQGSASDDVFDVAHSTGSFTINGGNGDDTIIGDRQTSIIDGQGGDDILTSSGRHDTIDGGAGNDVINDGDGSNLIRDNSGNNTIHGGGGADGLSMLAGNNRIFGDAGNDMIAIRKGTDIVDAGEGNDKIYLNVNPNPNHSEGAWTIHGGDGQDSLYALGNISSLKFDGLESLHLGDDHGTLILTAKMLDRFHAVHNAGGHVIELSGGGAFTWHHVAEDHLQGATLIGSTSADQIDLSASTSNWTIDGRAGDDVITGANPDKDLSPRSLLSGGTGNDTITGGRYFNIIDGGSGDDVLSGGQGYGSIYGDSGDDTLIAGSSSTFWGGSGKDTYVFSKGKGQAAIEDYDHVGADHDVLDFSAVGSIKDFDDMIKHHAAEHSDYVAIWYGSYTIILDHISLADLDKSAFIF